MKRLIGLLNLAILFFCFATTPASAQTTPQGICAPWGYTTPIAVHNLPVSPKFNCAPGNMLNGAGTWPQFRRFYGGVVAWNYCSDGFSYHYQMGVANMATLMTPSLYTDWAAAMVAPDTVVSLNDFANKHVNTTLLDPSLLPVWCSAYADIVARTPPPVPYIVTLRTDGGSYQRTYSYTTPFPAVRNPTPVGHVLTNTPCNCMTARSVESGVTYCSVPPQPAGTAPVVASCSVKK